MKCSIIKQIYLVLADVARDVTVYPLVGRLLAADEQTSLPVKVALFPDLGRIEALVFLIPLLDDLDAG